MVSQTILILKVLGTMTVYYSTSIRWKIVVHIIVVLVFVSCGGKSDKKEIKPIDTETLKEQVPNLASKNIEPHPGESVYIKYCLQCHRADGSGIPGMHPPLTPNKWIKDKEKMVEIVLNGMSGEIKIDGIVYDNLMPPHDHLTDLQLANVISYVRSNFGNELEPVTQKEVAAIRQKLKR